MPTSSALFDPTQTSLNSELGPLTSYRCFEFGVLCNGSDPGRSQGPRTNCVPGSKDSFPSRQLTPTQDFVTFLKGLKPQSPRMVHVSVIAGPPSNVMVGVDTNGYPDLQPACSGGIGEADPALRLSQFTTYFDTDRATFVSLCQPDLQSAMGSIAASVAAMMDH
jgi:hypothetical protein